MASKVSKGIPKRHRNAAKKARHARCWANSQRRKDRNRLKKGHRRLKTALKRSG